MEGAQQIEKRKGFLICLSGPGCALDQSRGRAFAGVRECLEQLCRVADVVELTATSTRAAHSEWSCHGLPPCGALATKKRDGAACLAELLARGYDRRKTLYVGCGPRDLAAAQTMGVLFYPILPGREAACWQELGEEALPKLLHGIFAGPYQQRLLARHNSIVKQWAESEYEEI